MAGIVLVSWCGASTAHLLSEASRRARARREHGAVVARVVPPRSTLDGPLTALRIARRAAVGGHAQVGDRVDVLGVFPAPGDGPSALAVRTVAQAAQVVGIAADDGRGAWFVVQGAFDEPAPTRVRLALRADADLSLREERWTTTVRTLLDGQGNRRRPGCSLTIRLPVVR